MASASDCVSHRGRHAMQSRNHMQQQTSKARRLAVNSNTHTCEPYPRLIDKADNPGLASSDVLTQHDAVLQAIQQNLHNMKTHLKPHRTTCIPPMETAASCTQSGLLKP